MDSLDLAADPATLPATLDALAHSTEAAILRVVAANPNAAPATLWRLAVAFPEEVSSNPALLLLSLDEPHALRKLPREVKVALAACAATPVPWLASLTEEMDYATMFLLGANPSTPQPSLEKLSCVINRHVRKKALDNPAMAASWIDLLERAGSQRDGDDFLPAMGELSREEMQRLAAAGYWANLLLARHPQTPPDLREGLVQPHHGWDWQYVRKAVALCPETPVALLESLREKRPELLEHLASNPSFPPAQLEALSRHVTSGIRVAVAGNPATPAAVLWLLATEVDRNAGAAACKNPGLGASWRELLVKAGFTAEPGSPGSLDAGELVQLAGGGVRARQLVARHEMAHFSLLSSLLTDASIWVRSALASRRSIPPPMLQTLLGDHEAVVRAAVAARADLDREAKDRLLADRHPVVLCRLTANAALSDEEASSALDVLLRIKVPGDKSERKHLIESLAARPTGAELLGRLVARSDPSIRLRVESYFQTVGQLNSHQLEICLAAPTTQCIPLGQISLQSPALQSLTEQTFLLAA